MTYQQEIVAAGFDPIAAAMVIETEGFYEITWSDGKGTEFVSVTTTKIDRVVEVLIMVKAPGWRMARARKADQESLY